jgi:hypothetical protein
VEPAGESDRSQHPCDLCGGTGEMVWQQPVPGPDGYVLRQVSHPCTNGCSGWWKLPAAERSDVIGWTTQANTSLTFGHPELPT